MKCGIGSLKDTTNREHITRFSKRMADQQASDDKICGLNLSIKWLEEKLKKTGGGEASDHIQEWSAKQIGVGQGFLSYIIRVEMKWSLPDSKLPPSVVLKVPTTDSIVPHMENMATEGGATDEEKASMKSSMMDTWFPIAMKNECSLYALLRGDRPCPLAHTWYEQEFKDLSDPGMLIMEDLSGNGALMNICDGLRPAQLHSIAEGLASLHAYSLKNQGKWNQNFPQLSRELVKDFPKMMEAAGINLEKVRPEYFKGKTETMRKNFDVDAFMSAALSYEELGLPPVLVNGDMWTNNLIFEKGADGKAGDKVLAFLDWQGTHPGNLTEDMSRVLVSSTTPEIRHQHGAKVFKHYYETLKTHMHGGVPFSFDDVMRAYDRILGYSMAFFIFALPVMANSPIVGEGDEKEKNIERLMIRGKCIVDDVIAQENAIAKS